VKIVTTMLALLSAALISACGGSDSDPPAESATAPGVAQPISQVAALQGFSSLLAAAEKAGLATALADPNASLTVFAPTDEAFNALATALGFQDAGAMVEALPASALAGVLQYHILPQRRSAADIGSAPRSEAATLYQFAGQAATLELDTTDGVRIEDAVLAEARVTAADVAASNGVIHVIDKVLVPPGVLNIVQMAQLNPAFSTLVEAVTETGLQEALSGPGPFTVFAPVNDAFAAVPGPLAAEQLRTVLTYHVLNAEVGAADIPFGSPVTTLATQPITIDAGDPPTIADTSAVRATIVATDVRASNGVIHVIDKVLIPQLQ